MATKKATKTMTPKAKDRSPKAASPFADAIRRAAGGNKEQVSRYKTGQEAFDTAYRFWGARRRLGLQTKVYVSVDRKAKTVRVGPRDKVEAEKGKGRKARPAKVTNVAS